MSTKRIFLTLLLCLAALGVARAGDDILTAEKIGPLRYDSPQSVVLKAFGKPVSKTKEDLEGATGKFVQRWSWPGLEVGMAGDKRGGTKSVATIKVSGKRVDLKTAKGIHIGSSEAEVRKAYGAVIDTSASSRGSIVAGSIYGGLIFTIRNGKVTEMFLGAAAE